MSNRIKICGVYKITNTITGDCYIGSSKDIKERWVHHKIPSTWNQHPNNPMYLDMERYGTDKFVFEILTEVEPEQLKETEQQFIETLKPAYNNRRADGWDVERHKETHKKAQKEYQNQLCLYNDQTLTLNALRKRFKRMGFEHPVIEAKKYLI